MNARPNKVVAADRRSSRAKISLPSVPAYTRLMASIAPTRTCTLDIELCPFRKVFKSCSLLWQQNTELVSFSISRATICAKFGVHRYNGHTLHPGNFLPYKQDRMKRFIARN
jgi:hypothetical protein